VFIGGAICDYLSPKLQVIFFTGTMSLSVISFVLVVFIPELPVYGIVILLFFYSVFLSPGFYLAGQFFSIRFGGNRHCATLDSLKGINEK
jgi:hypothetical protein